MSETIGEKEEEAHFPWGFTKDYHGAIFNRFFIRGSWSAQHANR